MIFQRIGNRGIRLGTLFERAARRHPANHLILDHDLDIAPGLGRRPTIVELAELVDDWAARLWAAGVRPGEYVVVFKSDSFDIPLLACAAGRIGAVPVLLSPKLDGDVVETLVRRIVSPSLLTDESMLANVLSPSVFEAAGRVLLASGNHPDATALWTLDAVERVTPVIAGPTRPALVTHTSGTTGTPKLAVHTGRTLQARYRPQAMVAGMVRKRRPVAIHVSFVHSRLFTALAITLLRGFPLLILADDDPDRVADMFLRVRPGAIEAHPNSFMRWEDLATDPRRPLAAVKFFSSTFDALHPRTVRRMLDASDHRFPVFGQLYGQSEVGPVVARAFTRFRSHRSDGRCVGVPFPGMTGIRVVSRDGGRPAAQTPGYIEVRTDGRIMTYLGEDDRYARQEHGGWWRMGDIGYRTRWGCVHLLDREVDEIPGFGSTLATEDALLTRIEQISEVVIVPNRDGPPIPVVCTKNDQPLDPRAWRLAVATLPTMSDPVQLRLADLPQTATTKIKRLELARRLGDDQYRSGRPQRV